MRDDLIGQVDSLVREVAATIVLPRWRHLSDGEIHQKAPGDLVTIADQESERALTAGLRLDREARDSLGSMLDTEGERIGE